MDQTFDHFLFGPAVHAGQPQHFVAAPEFDIDALTLFANLNPNPFLPSPPGPVHHQPCPFSQHLPEQLPSNNLPFPNQHEVMEHKIKTEPLNSNSGAGPSHQGSLNDPFLDPFPVQDQYNLQQLGAAMPPPPRQDVTLMQLNGPMPRPPTNPQPFNGPQQIQSPQTPLPPAQPSTSLAPAPRGKAAKNRGAVGLGNPPTSSEPCGVIVSHLLKYNKISDEEFAKKACESLIKKMKDKRDELDALITAVCTQGSKAQMCITIPRTLDGRLQVAGRKGFPHVVYARIFRWPELHKNELKHLSICKSAFDLKVETVCVNPYHYERILNPNIGQVDMSTFQFEQQQMPVATSTTIPLPEGMMPPPPPRGAITTPPMMSPGQMQAGMRGPMMPQQQQQHHHQTQPQQMMGPNGSQMQGARRQQHPHDNSYYHHAMTPYTPQYQDIQCDIPPPQTPANNMMHMNYQHHYSMQSEQQIQQQNQLRMEQPSSHPNADQEDQKRSVYTDLSSSGMKRNTSSGYFNANNANNNMSGPSHPMSYHNQAHDGYSQPPQTPFGAHDPNLQRPSWTPAADQQQQAYHPASMQSQQQPPQQSNTAPPANSQPSAPVASTDDHQQESSNKTTARKPFTQLGNVCARDRNCLIVDRELEPPTEKDTSQWVCIMYYERRDLVAEVQMTTPTVTVDGGMSSNKHRICVGPMMNLNRDFASERVRREIGNGVRFSVKDNGDVWMENLSHHPVFVTGAFLSTECGESAKASRVYKCYPNSVMKVYDLRQACLNLALQMQSIAMAKCYMRNIATPLDEYYRNMPENILAMEARRGADDLRDQCMIRMSFIKGFGEGYPVANVIDTPCWLEVKMNRAFSFLDELLHLFPVIHS